MTLRRSSRTMYIIIYRICCNNSWYKNTFSANLCWWKLHYRELWEPWISAYKKRHTANYFARKTGLWFVRATNCSDQYKNWNGDLPVYHVTKNGNGAGSETDVQHVYHVTKNGNGAGGETDLCTMLLRMGMELEVRPTCSMCTMLLRMGMELEVRLTCVYIYIPCY